MSDELPPEVLAVLRQLWESKEPLPVIFLPKDAWITVAVIQFASRNPQLSPAQRDAAITVARILQEAIQDRFPAAADLLEEGWNPAKDVPRGRKRR
ncbi:MAG: hypothetical protein HGA65_03460 [Oscillochloris sp.]|nr:hypothetical protein [Oscillochloris sp.]